MHSFIQKYLNKNQVLAPEIFKKYQKLPKRPGEEVDSQLE